MINKLIYNILIKNVRNFQHKRYFKTTQHTYNILKPPWKVLFFGTDDFSLPSLKLLNQEYNKGGIVQKLEVVTSLKAKKNAIESFASTQGLVVHNWRVDCSLCRQFDVGLVVSFGHLIPKDLIECFPLGMLNVHASLLPRWRGAAPIIHAIANGDKHTGITIMKIKPHHFDVGDIILQMLVEIPYAIKMPEMYKTLAQQGAENLLDVMHNLPGVLNKSIIQPSDGITLAPKVTADMSQINWQTMSARKIYNLGRALSGVFPLHTSFHNMPVKLHFITECDNYIDMDCVTPGLIVYNKNSQVLTVQCTDGKWVNIEKVGVPGKKLMSATDFKNGFLSKHAKHLRIFR